MKNRPVNAQFNEFYSIVNAIKLSLRVFIKLIKIIREKHACL